MSGCDPEDVLDSDSGEDSLGAELELDVELDSELVVDSGTELDSELVLDSGTELDSELVLDSGMELDSELELGTDSCGGGVATTSSEEEAGSLVLGAALLEGAVLVTLAAVEVETSLSPTCLATFLTVGRSSSVI